MATTTHSTRISEKCDNLLNEVQQVTGIRPRVGIMTRFNFETHLFDVGAAAPKGNPDALKLAGGNREISEKLRTEGRVAEIASERGDSYFRDEESDTGIKAAERVLLLANGYDPTRIHFYAIPVPPDTADIEEVFFLIAEDDKEKATFESHLNEILKKMR